MDLPKASEGGDTNAPMSEQEKKKLRNRLSQRAFRRRQAECMRELQSRVRADQRPESERVEALQKENRMLRQQLVDLQSNMSRMMATMQSLNDSVTKTLDSTAQGDEAPSSQADMVAVERVKHRPTSDQQPLDLNSFDLTTTGLEAPMGQTGCLESAAETNGTWFDLVNPAGTSPLYSQIPNIWSHEYQMGMQPYLAAVSATEQSRMVLGKHYPCTNSPFSDHIQLLQHMLKNKLDASGSIQSVYQPVLMVLSMFNSMTRPDVMAWYAKTRFFHIIDLTAWQLYPSSSTFEKLHPRYRPIKAQLENAHPLIIDWIPFPSVRDRLIQLHSANPHIDQIFCDAVTGYVVEALMSDLVLGAEPVQVYVRVTDLINTMASDTADNDETVAVLPAPDVATLFSSPAYARAAFNKLNMDRGAGYYKIDPAFFEKYPELYDQASELTAAGTPLKPTFQKILTYPKPLSHSTVETYRSFIDFSLDAINMITQSPEYLDMPSQTTTRMPSYSFMDDYSEGAHPALLKALVSSNTTQEIGYGNDTYCELARQRIRRHLGRDNVGIFFVPSGTSANAISIAACLRPHEAVIAASSGHIVTRETGAVEASGHKIINVAPHQGKLTPMVIERALKDNWHFPHMAKPRLVYISNATEIGTIYTRDELAAIKKVCEQNELILFLDGARIGTALASKANDMTLSDILELTDIFWIGGTKNGALLGEAVVVKDPRLASEFEFYVKQHGSLLAKGRVIGAQFAELFAEDLYFELARQANVAAETLSRGIAAAGFTVSAATETNQVFAALPLGLIKVLQDHFTFYVWERYGDDEAVIRLLTTWATDTEQVDRFVEMVHQWK
ncbi:pyridoxal phosphate-dependent transferase [Emericellopsis atlantica]|uniref:Pyridoxal phosphate-dependent transferase n=1 Tax=Emericellopsis atlantica TaxID=2614577 RepID=A0A9P7ZHS9_9HYPO|nr:pyridoxal phosphate-dependent transferase [Emericellopsis atlantica]KAG9251795.1 pyridoxal phosphate-dependent transferase [Emericellopsis atlantica]